MRGPKDLSCGRRVRVTAGYRIREIPLQRDHLLAGDFSLLRIELGLLNCQHRPHSLFIFPLPERCVRLRHGSFGVPLHLSGIKHRPGWRLRGCFGRSRLWSSCSCIGRGSTGGLRGA